MLSYDCGEEVDFAEYQFTGITLTDEFKAVLEAIKPGSTSDEVVASYLNFNIFNATLEYRYYFTDDMDEPTNIITVPIESIVLGTGGSFEVEGDKVDES